MNEMLDKKRRRTGLVLAGLGVAVWLVFACKAHKEQKVFPAAQSNLKPYIAQHITQESNNLFSSNAGDIARKENDSVK